MDDHEADDQHQLLSSRVFSNEVILKNIFKFLPVRDLKSIRLVSSPLKDICSPIFRRKTTVKLDGDKIMTRFLKDFAATPSSHVPFSNYTFRHCTLGHSELVMEAFREKFGPSVESIELWCVKMVGLKIVRDLLFNMCPNLKKISVWSCSYYNPEEESEYHDGIAELDQNVKVNTNLTKFKYHCCDYSEDDELPISWEEIFMAYPNITDLSFEELRATTTDSILEIAKSLKTKNPNSFQLQKLGIFNGDHFDFLDNNIMMRETHPYVVDLDCLLSLELSLKRLKIQLGTRIQNEQFARLLHQQRNVEKLKLRGGPCAIAIHGFPFGVQFDHLRHLEMADTISDSMEFLKFMPNLFSLKLLFVPNVEQPFDCVPVVNIISKTDINFAQMPLQTKLTKIEIEYETGSLDAKKLVFWFPGVVNAKLHLDNEGFRSVCRHWKKLEELEVYGGKLTTEGITGIYDIRGASVKEYNPTNITCLTNLRQFTMEYIMGDEKISDLDDLSLDEGFLKLPHLKNLSIFSKNISKEGWAKLRNWEQLIVKPSLCASNCEDFDEEWE